MQQAGDAHLRWGRAPRFVAESIGAATWQQRATLSAAFLGACTCAWLIVHLLGLEISVPGLGSPIRTPGFAPAPVVHVRPAVRARPMVPKVHANAPRQPLVAAPPKTVSRPRATQPSTNAPPPEAPAPQPPQQQPPVDAAPPPAPAAILPAPPAAPVPAVPELPPLPELPVPVPEPLPSLPVPLPAIP